jgi:sec-independent protein translocase protein TatC
MALDQQQGEEGEMSFLDHLEELRWHIVRSVGAILIFMIAAFVNIEWIFSNILLAPVKSSFITFRLICQLGHKVGLENALCVADFPFTLQSRYVTGQFSMMFTASAVIGLIVAFPYVFWEIWRFIRPGLYTTEKKGSRGAVAAVTGLFLMGVGFGYFILTPISMYFFANYKISEMIVNEFDITSYISTIVALVFGSGLLFQLPVVIFFLTRVGLVSPKFLRTYRKYAVIIILVLAAIITPPDPLSQMIVAIPLYILYEISIFISGVELKRKLRVQAEEEAAEANKGRS